VHGHLVELGGRRCRHRRLAKLRGRLKERRKRGQPHGRLAEVHGGLAELNGGGRLHRCLAELGRKGHLHRCLVKLHGHLTKVGGRRRPHRRLVELSGRGQLHSRLAEPSLEEWQEHSPTEEDDRTIIWKNGKRGAGLWLEPTRNPGAKTFTGRTKFSLKDGNNI
jgi:hypothetical protein